MNEAFSWFTILLTVGLEAWMTVYLSTAFFRLRISHKLYILLCIVFYITEVIWLLVWAQFFGNYLVIKYLANIIIIIIWLSITCSGTVIQFSFFGALILSYFTIIDNLLMFLIPSTGEVVQFALNDPYAYFAVCCCMKITELFGIIIIRFVAKKRKIANSSYHVSEWIKTSFFPFSTLVISVIMSRIIVSDLSYAKEIAMCMFVMLIFDLISIYFLEHLESSHRALRENAILRQNLKLETDHIASLQENYELQRKQTHDFYNHLATLQGMAEKSVPLEDFSRYLGTLLATKPPAVFYINTQRIVVDVVLSQKVPFARDEGIDFQFQLENLSQFPLPDDALVVILTNLIDNAIEACEKIPIEQERFIQLVMKTEGKTAWLCIENTTAAPVDIQNNSVITTKSDPLLHGYGLKNISALISQNNGTYVLDYREKDHRFCFYSTIPNTD